MRRGAWVTVVGAGLLGLALACGGGRSAPSGGGAAEPLTVGVQGGSAGASSAGGGAEASPADGGAGASASAAPKKLSFGKPALWSQDKREYEDGGHPVVHYTLSGEAATVQIILHPPGAAVPDPDREREGFQAMLREQIPEGLAFDEVVPHTRTLAGQQVQGGIQGLTLRAPDGVIHGEHRSYPVQGAATSALVVIDIPDVSHPTAEQEVEEVLGPLVIP